MLKDFFLSSRRRHTRCYRDWSSDVCSSDLDAAVLMAVKAWKMDPKDITMLQTGGTSARMAALLSKKVDATVQSYPEIFEARKLRSEERRVGKEGRCRWS